MAKPTRSSEYGPVPVTETSPRRARVTRAARTATAATRLPPASYFGVSAVFHYLGPSLAVLLFARVSVLGVAWLRIASAAVVFAAWRRPWRLWPRLTTRQKWVLAGLGAVLAVMNSVFYLACDRLPLSTVGAIEFLGTVLLAVAGARTRRNLLALVLAVGGVALLTDIRLAGEPAGFAFAFANCALFMLYVVLGHRIANEGPAGPAGPALTGIDQLAAAMIAGHDRGHAVRAGRRAARVQPPGLAAVGRRGRPLLLGDPVRHRPAGHGPAAAGHVRADAGPAAGRGHGHRAGRAAPGANGGGSRRGRAGRRRGGGAQGWDNNEEA